MAVNRGARLTLRQEYVTVLDDYLLREFGIPYSEKPALWHEPIGERKSRIEAHTAKGIIGIISTRNNTGTKAVWTFEPDADYNHYLEEVSIYGSDVL